MAVIHGTKGADVLLGALNEINEIWGHRDGDRLTGGKLEDLLKNSARIIADRRSRFQSRNFPNPQATEADAFDCSIRFRARSNIDPVDHLRKIHCRQTDCISIRDSPTQASTFLRLVALAPLHETNNSRGSQTPFRKHRS